jgi:hypothetical protein
MNSTSALSSPLKERIPPKPEKQRWYKDGFDWLFRPKKLRKRKAAEAEWNIYEFLHGWKES